MTKSETILLAAATALGLTAIALPTLQIILG
jgi:hypothetical protein